MHPPPAPILLLLLLALAAQSAAQSPVRLGELSQLDHRLAGEVFALNDRLLEVRNFNYDGLGPDAYFWADRGTTATRNGIILPERPGCAKSRLPAYSSKTVLVELPAGETLSSIGYLSVWCRRAVVSFGGLRIDPALVANLPNGAASTTCSAAAVEPFPVAATMNCEPLERDNFQLRWRVEGPDLVVQLVGRISDSQYMGFGPSGNDSRTNMDGADPAIAFESNGTFLAVDYSMTGRAQCSQGVGVCPDVRLASPGVDQITNVSGSRKNDLVQISYRRPLRAVDSEADRPFSTTGETFIVWAIGPIERSEGIVLAQFHKTRTIPRQQSVSFEFGRERFNGCTNMLLAGSGAQPDEDNTAKASPWPDRAPIIAKENEEIVARIGPSGGDRGREAVVGEPGWGIAWYMNDILTTVIAVERNKTYKFRVYGGDDATKPAQHHPLYITSDSKGGLVAKSETLQKDEKVWAQPVEGALCAYKVQDNTKADAETFAEYFQSLDRSCASDKAITDAGGLLTWKVAPDTPDTVYYQCATHLELGFKIRVYDEGRIDMNELTQLNLNQVDTSCSIQFKGNTRTFQGCRKGLTGDVDVYWNIVNDEIETLFVGTPPTGGYVGWGWGSLEMVGTNAAIAYANSSGDGARIEDYFLAARSTTGVQIEGRQKFSSSDAEVTAAGEVRGLFVRPLGNGVSVGPTNAIWAIGPKVSAPDALERHGTRASAEIDLSETSGDVVSRSVLSTGLKVHGALMSLSWVALAPAGALAMRFLKRFNPATFQGHRGLMVTAVLVAVAAYILGLVKGNRGHIAHLVIGSIVLGLAFLQVLGGAFRPEKGTEKRPIFNMLHGWSGRVVLVLAAVNLYLGLAAADAVWWLYLLMSLGVGLWVVVFLVLQFVLARQFPVVEEEKTSQDEEREELAEGSM